jgi:hypothetical protein
MDKVYLRHRQANKFVEYGGIIKLLQEHDCFISLIFVFRAMLWILLSYINYEQA